MLSMENEIASIIKSRIVGPLVGNGIVMVVGVYSMKDIDNKIVFALIMAAFVMFFTILSILNFNNYPTPKSYYRTFNKIVYIWLPRIALVGLVFDLYSNVRNYNPLRAGNPSLGETALNAGLDVGAMAVTKKQIGTAKFIDSYFNNSTQR